MDICAQRFERNSRKFRNADESHVVIISLQIGNNKPLEKRSQFLRTLQQQCDLCQAMKLFPNCENIINGMAINIVYCRFVKNQTIYETYPPVVVFNYDFHRLNWHS